MQPLREKFVRKSSYCNFSVINGLNDTMGPRLPSGHLCHWVASSRNLRFSSAQYFLMFLIPPVNEPQESVMLMLSPILAVDPSISLRSAAWHLSEPRRYDCVRADLGSGGQVTDSAVSLEW